MPETSSPGPAERRRETRRARRRADSPVALVAWAAAAAVVMYGQVQRPGALADAPAADALPYRAPWDATPNVAAPTVTAPHFSAPLTGAVVTLDRAPVAAPPVTVATAAPTTVAPAAPERVAMATATAKGANGKKLAPSRAAAVTPRRPFAAMKHPKVAFASPLLMPRLHLPRVLEPRLAALEGLLARARPGQPVAVRLSAYCLRGATRRGSAVRTGIVAADPRVFPLAGHVELYAGGRYLGRYLVDDTGHHIKGPRIDIWTPDCDDARRFGMREGIAALVPGS